MAYKPLDPLHQKILLGTAACFARAVERARQTGKLMVVWRDNQVAHISPDEFIREPDAPKPDTPA